MKHRAADLIHLFNTTFLASHNTVLVGGAEEPIYLPADGEYRHHRIIFTRDYFASALHEVAHWCIAGAERRQRVDYGYWYEPDGRGADQQAEFERVEARPQAIEKAFSLACSAPFRVSLDNLDGAVIDSRGFEERVRKEHESLSATGFPPRAERFIAALRTFYQAPDASNRGRSLKTDHDDDSGKDGGAVRLPPQ